MKKVIHIVVLLFLVTSCFTEKEFNGVWVGAYAYDSISDNSFPYPITEVIEFRDGNYKVERFMFNGSDDRGKYRTFFRNFYLDSLNLNVEFINKDSLVFKDFGSSRVYYKLHDSLKLKKPIRNLVNKTFSLKIRDFKDTISFLNDSMAMRIANSKSDKIFWEKVDLGGFSLLLLDGALPTVIVNDGKNGYQLIQQFKNEKFLIEMKEVSDNNKN